MYIFVVVFWCGLWWIHLSNSALPSRNQNSDRTFPLDESSWEKFLFLFSAHLTTTITTTAHSAQPSTAKSNMQLRPMKANEQNPWADWYQIRAKGSVLTSHIAKLSEDSAAAIKRLAWRRWCLIMHTLSISVILSNVKCTQKLCFFNAQNRKLIHAYVSDPLFVGAEEA